MSSGATAGSSDDQLIFRVPEEFSKLIPFNRGFMSWILEAHPEEAARMSGTLMGGSFNPEDAEIALQYVEEFVAQSVPSRRLLSPCAA